MIYDTLTNLSCYTGLHPNLDLALEFLENKNLEKLPLGRTDIDGEKVYINVMNAETKDAEELEYEFHKKYLDIQIDIIGKERISFGYDANKDTSIYDVVNDFGTLQCDTEESIDLGKGKFVICMLNEPHKPGVKLSTHKKIKKCVVKVLIE